MKNVERSTGTATYTWIPRWRLGDVQISGGGMNSAFIKCQLAVVQAKEARLRAARAEIEAAIFRGHGQTPLRGALAKW